VELRIICWMSKVAKIENHQPATNMSKTIKNLYPL